jgi:excisionase family DNA binding protein
MKKEPFDAMSYIESAFLDLKTEEEVPEVEDLAEDIDTLPSFTRNYSTKAKVKKPAAPSMEHAVEIVDGKDVRLKSTTMKAPRPRRRREAGRAPAIGRNREEIWHQIPKNLKFLARVYDDNVTQKYYSTEFKESREDLIMRMMDPQLNLEEAARLLGVCPATVRRYTNRGWLQHHRTMGNQRRFKLSGIVNFVEAFGRNPE